MPKEYTPHCIWQTGITEAQAATDATIKCPQAECTLALLIDTSEQAVYNWEGSCKSGFDDDQAYAEAEILATKLGSLIKRAD